MPLTTLTEDEERELCRLHRLYWREARRCNKAKSYLAGCVMLGSALETLLILTVNCFPEEAEQTGKFPRGLKKREKLLKWDLADLLAVAKAANWLPAGLALTDDWNSRRAQVGDHAEVVRKVRNLAHPARYLTDHYRSRVTQKYLQHQFKVVRLCRDWLRERVERSLLEHMKAEGTD